MSHKIAPEQLEDTVDSNGYVEVTNEIKPITKVKPYVEEYHLVNFAERSGEEEERDIVLEKGTDRLQFERGKNVVCPKSFLEIADQTKRPIWKRDSDNSLHIAGYKQSHRYSILEKNVGKALFDKQRREGQVAIKKYLQDREQK
jgi:hypothetical protein